MSELEALLAEMVRIDSTNPGLAGGPGEGAFAAWFARRLEGLGMEVDVWDVLPAGPTSSAGFPAPGTARASCSSATWMWSGRGVRTRSSRSSATDACTAGAPPT